MAKSFFKLENRECWVPNKEPEHDDFYATNEGDWICKDLLELLPEFSANVSEENSYP